MPINQKLKIVFSVLLLTAIPAKAQAPKDTNSVGYTVAVLQFSPQDDSMKNPAQAMSSLMQVFMSAAPDVIPIERADVDKAVEEIELTLSGNVNPDQAVKIGQITGAQILVVGKMFAVENQMFAVAKVVSTETTRVFGAVVSDTLRGDIKKMATELSTKIMEILSEKKDILLPKASAKDTWLRDVRDSLTGRELPTLSVRVSEKSMSSDISNPTSSTVFQQILLDLGSSLIDPLTSTDRAEIEVTGNATSEFGLRKGNLVSSKARVEFRAIEAKSGKVLAVASESAVAVDLGAEYAGKKAIDLATVNAAKKILPVLANCCSIKKIVKAETEAKAPLSDKLPPEEN